VGDPFRIQPTPRFLHRVAVFDAVDSDHCAKVAPYWG
jgi:hypothetical protein